MTSLQILEERIAELEKKVYGPGGSKQTKPENSLIDILLHANTLISSALSGREKANTLIKRLPELNAYMENNLDDNDLQTDAKLELILALEPQICEILQSLRQVKMLMPILETDHFRDIPEQSKKLNELTSNYIKANEEINSLSATVREMFAKHTSIINNITEIFLSLDASLTALELASKMKEKE